MNIIRNWKPFAAVSCSHGHHVDPVARASVLKFMADFCKPAGSKRIHLGDFIDMEAFMGGGKGEGEPLAPDIQAGLEFLEDGKFNVVLCGNHEDRLWKLASHSNEIVAECASMLKGKIEATAKMLKAELIPYNGIFQEYRFGTAKACHGTVFNQTTSRDQAEIESDAEVIISGHTHRPEIQLGRTTRRAISINVGTLETLRVNNYAKTRRATLGWGQGIAYGEWCDTGCMAQLYVHPLSLTGKPWRIAT